MDRADCTQTTTTLGSQLGVSGTDLEHKLTSVLLYQNSSGTHRAPSNPTQLLNPSETAEVVSE